MYPPPPLQSVVPPRPAPLVRSSSSLALSSSVRRWCGEVARYNVVPTRMDWGRFHAEKRSAKGWQKMAGSTKESRCPDNPDLSGRGTLQSSLASSSSTSSSVSSSSGSLRSGERLGSPLPPVDFARTCTSRELVPLTGESYHPLFSPSVFAIARRSVRNVRIPISRAHTHQEPRSRKFRAFRV